MRPFESESRVYVNSILRDTAQAFNLHRGEVGEFEDLPKNERLRLAVKDHKRYKTPQKRRFRLGGLAPKEAILDGDRATKKDIRLRQEEQYQRYMGLLRKGKLTPPWRRFGQRHGKEIA